ncbi:MAG: N-acetylglucosamine-6-phosphate deacetylase, partial [Lachnospiraceae bacterium]|nr:N-acetylglucosamine-6-phosphate deacetylase [Lachnospiraceae bacterium]
MWLLGGNVYIAEQGFCKRNLLLRNGIIERIVPQGETVEEARLHDAETVDVQGATILPGLVDLHFHGCAGHDFCEGTREAFEAIEQYELRHGITVISPATMTLPEERLCQICSEAAAYAKASECL